MESIEQVEEADNGEVMKIIKNGTTLLETLKTRNCNLTRCIVRNNMKNRPQRYSRWSKKKERKENVKIRNRKNKVKYLNAHSCAPPPREIPLRLVECLCIFYELQLIMQVK